MNQGLRQHRRLRLKPAPHSALRCYGWLLVAEREKKHTEVWRWREA